MIAAASGHARGSHLLQRARPAVDDALSGVSCSAASRSFRRCQHASQALPKIACLQRIDLEALAASFSVTDI
jgi:hypothetical protein